MTEARRRRHAELLWAYFEEGKSPIEAWRALHPDDDRPGDLVNALAGDEMRWLKAETDRESAAPVKEADVPGPGERSPGKAPARRKRRRSGKRTRCLGTADQKCQSRVRGRRTRCGCCRKLVKQQYQRKYYLDNRERWPERREQRERERQRRADVKEGTRVVASVLVDISGGRFEMRLDDSKDQYYLYLPRTGKAHYLDKWLKESSGDALPDDHSATPANAAPAPTPGDAAAQPREASSLPPGPDPPAPAERQPVPRAFDGLLH